MSTAKAKSQIPLIPIVKRDELLITVWLDPDLHKMRIWTVDTRKRTYTELSDNGRLDRINAALASHMADLVQVVKNLGLNEPNRD